RVRHGVRIALGTCAALAIAIGMAAWWTVYTEGGARWGFDQLGAILPGKLDVKEIQGPLHGPLEARQITYRTEKMEVRIDRLQLVWHLGWLLRRRLEIESLHAENVRVLLGAPGETQAARDSLASPLPDVNLPVNIIVRDGAVDHLQITTPASDSGFVIDRVAL